MKKLMPIMLVLMLLMTACAESKSIETVVKGYEGDIKVSSTFKDGKITEIKVLEHKESEYIGQGAVDIIPSRIVEEQSVLVDAVAGATGTSSAIKEAVALAIEEAGLELASFKKTPQVKLAGDDIEKTTDVLVIGGGGAGLSAAVTAAENGAQVILVEKAEMLGGNTVRAGGAYNAVDPDRQKSVEVANEKAMESIEKLIDKEMKRSSSGEETSEIHRKHLADLTYELTEYKNRNQDHLFDSPSLHILQTYNGGDYAGKIEFIEKLCESSLDILKWLERNGMEWQKDIATVPGGLWPRAHIPKNAAGVDFITTNKAKAEELGVEIILECAGKDLIVKNGKVIGAFCEKSDGTKVIINTNKAVILATGGFAGNKEMREHYDPSLVKELGTTNSPTIQGDGIKIAEKVNANLIGMEYIQCLPWGNPKNGSLNGWLGGIGVEYYYQVNTDGKRFMAEDGRRDDMTKSLLEQEGAMSFVITDTNRESENSETNLWGDNIEELVENGTVFRADTVEDLAKQIDVDPVVLKETHEKFNSYVESGVDKDFGRKLFGDKIDKAPFYASPRMPTVHHTMGGIEIDLNCRVLDKNGNVIEGLYACGEVTGGIHGKNRLGGNALVDAHVFGHLAGEQASK